MRNSENVEDFMKIRRIEEILRISGFWRVEGIQGIKRIQRNLKN